MCGGLTNRAGDRSLRNQPLIYIFIQSVNAFSTFMTFQVILWVSGIHGKEKKFLLLGTYAWWGRDRKHISQ